MLGQVEFPLTNSQMLDFFLDKSYTDYFTFQTVINELVSTSLVMSESVHNSSHYTLTEHGVNTLHFFGNNIPQAIREEMDTFLKENHVKLRNESGITADYYKAGNNDYIVRCQIKEGNSLLYAVEISVPSEEQAIRVCSNWSRSNQDVYMETIKYLFK